MEKLCSLTICLKGAILNDVKRLNAMNKARIACAEAGVEMAESALAEIAALSQKVGIAAVESILGYEETDLMAGNYYDNVKEADDEQRRRTDEYLKAARENGK